MAILDKVANGRNGYWMKWLSDVQVFSDFSPVGGGKADTRAI